ncbi:MAG: UvrABC system protein C [uncultured bacterium]|nr:MAG: UvrABC system protein C [uncultured bacterium]
MVVFSAQGGSASGGDYFPEKSAYRKFKIKTVEGQSDVDCLREVLERRIARILTQNDADRWPAPDVILIDGGKPQVNAAMQILKKHKLNIPLVGIAKGPERKRNDFIFGVKTREFIKFVNENQDLLIRVRDEAHRFAITFQRSLRKLKHKNIKTV